MRMIARENKGVDIEKVTATVKDLDNQFSKDYQSMQQEFESIVNAHKEITKPKEVTILKRKFQKKSTKMNKESLKLSFIFF